MITVQPLAANNHLELVLSPTLIYKQNPSVFDTLRIMEGKGKPTASKFEWIERAADKNHLLNVKAP